MANTLRFKRGLASGIPTALAGEPLFTTDTFDLYIGNGTTNTRFQKYIASGTTSQLLRGDGSLLTMPIVLTSPSNGQVLKFNGTSWVNDSDAGITGSGSSGQVAYFTGATTQAGSNNLFWDNTNARLGIGTVSPFTRLDSLSTRTTTLNSIASFNTMPLSVTDDTALAAGVGGGINFRARLTSTSFSTYAAIWSFRDVSTNSDYKGSLIFGTANNTNGYPEEAMRIFSTRNVGINTGATDSGQRLQVTGTSYFSDSVGIGITAGISIASLRLGRNITGGATAFGVLIGGAIQSDVTTAVYSGTTATTAASTFTVGNLYHYLAGQGTFGAGSTVTNQYGFFAESSLTGATNDYGFYGNLAAGTNIWNLYMNGTANNYLAGNLGVGDNLFLAGWTKAIYIGNNGANKVIAGYLASSTNGAAIGSMGSALTGWTPLNIVGSTLLFHTNGEGVKMTLDAIGNLGLGVTPSATSGGYKNVQNGNAVMMGSASDQTAYWNNNATFNSGWKYIANGASTRYEQGTGHFWFTAASGTAGNAITFTQAMTLFSTNNLAIGSASDSGERLQVTGTAKITGASTFTATGASISMTTAGDTSIWSQVTNAGGILYVGRDNAAGGSFGVANAHVIYGTAARPMVFFTNSAERMRLDASGNLGLGVTNPSEKLQIAGNILLVSGYNLYGNSTSGNYSRIELYNASTGNMTLGTYFATASMLFLTNGTERMRINAAGNLLIGSTTDSGEKLQVTGTMKITGASTFGSSIIASGLVSAATEFRLNNHSFARIAILNTSGGIAGGYNLSLSSNVAQHDSTGTIAGYYHHNTGYIAFYTNTSQAAGTVATERMRLDASGNLGLGTTTTTNRLNVTRSGSGVVATFDSDANASITIRRTGTSAGTTTLNQADSGELYMSSTTRMYFNTNSSNNFLINNNGNVLIQTGGTFSDGGEKLQVTGTARISGEFRVAATINSTQATFANTTGRGLAISTAVVGGTNEAAVVLNARSSVTSGTFIFQTDGTQRVQIDSTGLIINGGNALEFINSAANAVSAIRPTGGGTSIMSTNSNGLHIAVGTEAAGDLILASNNTERVRLSSNGWFSHASATNPSSSVTDSYVQYSADVTAGNAAPHFRTENGAVIKLYQETTAVGNSIISLGGGSAVLDDTTFDGYTLRQIVKALRNQGILA